jgi:predicted nucleic acid-binding protein
VTAVTPAVPSQLAVIDASVWVSGVLLGDVNRIRARTWINQHIGSGGYLVSPLIFPLETGSAIARVTQNLTLARQAVSEVYLFPYLRLAPVDQVLIDDAIDIALTFRLRGADSLYVAVAKQLGIPLVTLDHEQLTRPASIITTVQP